MGRANAGARVLKALMSCAIVALQIPETAQAYTPTITGGGTVVRWKGPVHLYLAGNPGNIIGFDSGSFYGSVVRGLQRWKAASNGGVSFDYWQGTDPVVYEANSDYNGLSSIYFASQSRTGLPSNVLGLTQVWYNTDTGQILETDIALNDSSYTFTSNPRDTSGYGSTGGGSGSGTRVFIENVITHELGHALGLAHSGGLQSTMLFMESPEQAYLACDEQTGIRALYSPKGGSISGRVLSESGAGVFGAHVLAVSRQRGTVVGTAITDAGGSYSIGSLEQGDYFLVAEPFYAGSSALPSYFGGINPNVCGGSPFARSFLRSGNTPTPVGVYGGATSAPDLTARCTSGAAVNSLGGTMALGSAPVVHEGATGGFGVVDRIGNSGTYYYKVRSVSGKLEVRALAYSLYSPIRAKVRLLNSLGVEVSNVEVADSVYVGSSGFVNYDSALIASDLPSDDYVVEVSSVRLNETVYPAGNRSVDSVPFVMLAGSVNQGGPTGDLAFNARCRMDENFPAYSSPPGGPPRFAGDIEEGTGFCGTLGGSDGKSGGGGGASAGAIAGWFLPWLMMAAYLWRELRVSRAAATLRE